MLCKSVDWFLYDNDPHHERVKVTSIGIMKRWVKDIFTLNNIVEFSPHSYQAKSVSEAKHGSPDWKYTQMRLLKKLKKEKHKA